MTIEIPARRGKATHVARGRHIKVINTHGEQVVDTWAFDGENLREFMSMEHTRAHTLAIVPRVGDVLRTNQRRPILTLRRGHVCWYSRHSDRGLRPLPLRLARGQGPP